jgi:hypothetical protein
MTIPIIETLKKVVVAAKEKDVNKVSLLIKSIRNLRERMEQDAFSKNPSSGSVLKEGLKEEVFIKISYAGVTMLATENPEQEFDLVCDELNISLNFDNK